MEVKELLTKLNKEKQILQGIISSDKEKLDTHDKIPKATYKYLIASNTINLNLIETTIQTIILRVRPEDQP